MRKMCYLLTGITMVSITIAGCARNIEISTIKKERLDQETAGNRGYVKGTSAAIDDPKGEKTREIFRVVVDVPPYSFDKSKPAPDNEIWGNKGIFQRGTYKPEKTLPKFIPPKQQPQREVVPLTLIPEEEIKISPDIVELQKEQEKQITPGKQVTPEKQVKYEQYIVQKNDSLWKIAKKTYGNPNKWRLIYEANLNVIKDPNKLRTGQKLIIPR
ncbi:MAG: LysM peptidoglycan-binding domain-containing protein [Candidatus Omnitrophota bacterium]